MTEVYKGGFVKQTRTEKFEDDTEQLGPGDVGLSRRRLDDGIAGPTAVVGGQKVIARFDTTGEGITQNDALKLTSDAL